MYDINGGELMYTFGSDTNGKREKRYLSEDSTC